MTCTSHSSMLVLSQLPDNILLHIIREVPQHELYPLSLLSRRLHELALRLFLRRNKITEPTVKAELIMRWPMPKGISVLSVLRIALFVPSIEHLTCIFHSDYHKYPLATEQVEAAFSPLLALIQKLSAVVELTLHLQDTWIRQGFQWEVYNFLHGPLATKSCSRLVITDYTGVRVYARQPALARIVPSSTMHALFDYAAHPMRRSASTPSTDSSAKHQLTFSSFVIKNATELRNIARTSSTLSTVRNLELACPGNSGREWSHALSHISSTALCLEALVVDITDIIPSDLLSFVSKLPRLISLTITVLAEHRNHTIPSRTSLKFPPFIDLRVPPAYALVFLAGIQNLSCLKTLNLLIPDRDQLFSVTYQKTLSTIIAILGSRIHHISLNMVVNFTDSLSRDGRSIMNNLDHFVQSGIGREMTFGQVPKLTLLGLAPLGARRCPEYFFLLLAIWLRKFRGVRHLEFIEQNCTDGAKQSIYHLFRAIHTQCRNIMTVTLLGTRYDIAATLAEKESFLPRECGTKFTDLPEDIFYVIFQYLSDMELYSLANLSRNIRHCVLLVYLRRRGIHNPTVLTEVHFAGDASATLTDLSALTLLPIQTIQHLSCRIFDSTKLFLSFEFFHRFHRLILGLSTLDKVTLDFRCLPYKEEVPVMEAAKRVWTSLLTSILDAIAERGCTSLIVHGARFFETIAHPRMARSRSRILGFPLRILNAVPSSAPIGISSWKMSSVLSSLTVDSETLLSPIFHNWIISTFEHSHVTSLSVTHISFHVANLLLKTVDSLSSLTELHLAGGGIFSTGGVSLLHKLSSLTILSLSDCSFDGLPSGPSPRLPLLRALSLPADCIGFFMKTNVNALPSLEKLTLTIESEHRLTTSRLECLPTVAEQLKARKSFSSLSLEVPLHRAFKIVEQIRQDGWWIDLSNLVMTIKFIELDSWTGMLPPLLSFPSLRHLIFEIIDEGRLIHALRSKGDIKPSLLTVTINGIPQDLKELFASNSRLSEHALARSLHSLRPTIPS